MAEFVELRLEEMLPELEQMQRVNLFTDQEIKDIIKRRREFEYKLQKRTKAKEDYLKYIQYEIDLLGLLKQRREEIGYTHKQSEIDYTIAMRVNKLFSYVVLRFQDDVKLWLSQIDFCKSMKWTVTISRLYLRMLAVHGHQPALWVLAAKWEMEDNQSIEGARTLLLRALRMHPKSLPLHVEAMRLELLAAEQLRLRQEVLGITENKDLPEETKDDILNGHLGALVYKNAVNEEKKGGSGFVQKAEDFVAFLAVAKTFHFATDLQNTILEDLKQRFPEDSVTWDTLARAKLDKKQNDTPFKDRIEHCCSVYKEGLTQNPSSKLWNFYLDTLTELQQSGKMSSLVNRLLDEARRECMSSSSMSKEHLKVWIQHLEDENSVLLPDVLEYAVKEDKKNVDFWRQLVRSALRRKEDVLFVIDGAEGNNFKKQRKQKSESDSDSSDDEAEKSEDSVRLPEVFWEAVETLGDDAKAVSVWEEVGDYLREKGAEAAKAVKQFAKEASRRGLEIGRVAKLICMKWEFEVHGVEGARKFYEANQAVPPLSFELHYYMVDLELSKSSAPADQNRVRKVFENACTQFGKDNPDLWLRYIEFETNRGNPMQVGKLHYRAKNTLTAAASDVFLAQYSLASVS